MNLKRILLSVLSIASAQREAIVATVRQLPIQPVDKETIRAKASPTVPGDMDGDGDVDLIDALRGALDDLPDDLGAVCREAAEEAVKRLTPDVFEPFVLPLVERVVEAAVQRLNPILDAKIEGMIAAVETKLAANRAAGDETA